MSGNFREVLGSFKYPPQFLSKNFYDFWVEYLQMVRDFKIVYTFQYAEIR